jgi:hypothetical protein
VAASATTPLLRRRVHPTRPHSLPAGTVTLAKRGIATALADGFCEMCELRRFDFTYDRGCHHEVRQHDPRACMAAVSRLTHDRSKILGRRDSRTCSWCLVARQPPANAACILGFCRARP